MNACPHKHGCTGNYLLAWNVAQMSAIPSISLASYSPRSVYISFFSYCLKHGKGLDKYIIVIKMEFCESK